MPLMDFADTLSRMGETYTLKAGAAGSVVDGHHVPGAGAETTVTAVVQPIEGEELQRLPEGWRVDEVLVAFTSTQVQGLDEATGRGPDVLVVDGDEYQVERVEPWVKLGNFYRVLLRRVDR